jgi:flagellar basal-body rod protein FlgF
MNRGIYSTATGMVAAQRWMDVTANNLANASTNGFKRDGLIFNDAMERELAASGGLGTRLGSIGSGAMPKKQYTVFERGPLTATGNPLDMAIDSDQGMFAVQTPGGVRYTRDGSFALNEKRELVTKCGFQVLNEKLEPIVIPAGKLEMSGQGHVAVDGKAMGKIAVFDGPFLKEGENLFTAPQAQAVEFAGIRSYSVEGSNVNAVEAMISMISLSRSFEMAQKSITQQDELTQRLVQSLQDR